MTNHLETLDPGIVNRPGGFDRKCSFPMPNVYFVDHRGHGADLRGGDGGNGGGGGDGEGGEDGEDGNGDESGLFGRIIKEQINSLKRGMLVG
ncbi:unnamed protein product [Tuber aestivum]|uniref:Uncharacterized protein n=1 Tax=Tuber aestivum TaxID=59557 RepID=A0A292PXE6_9PEZI|nr:unnamed protein product [Tuber aestivum]